jgi:tetratricopeptide (TPR) repeat protein
MFRRRWVIGLMFISCLLPGADKFQGKTAAQWLAQFESANSSNNMPARNEALSALKQIGAPAATLIATRFVEFATITDLNGILQVHASIAYPELIDLPQINEQSIDQELIRMLSWSGQVQPLRQRLRDDRAFMRVRAAQALGCMAQMEQVRRLVAPAMSDAIEFRNDNDERIRQAAMRIMVLPEPPIDEARARIFIESLNDSDRLTSALAAQGVRSLRPELLKPLLPELLAAGDKCLRTPSPNGEVLESAAVAIGSLKADGAPGIDLLKRLVRGGGNLAWTAYAALRQIGIPALPAMIELVDVMGRAQLIKSITGLGQQAGSTLPLLITFLDDPSDDVKSATLQAISVVAPHSPQAIDAMQQFAAREPKFADTVKMLLDQMDRTEPLRPRVAWNPTTVAATRPAERNQAEIAAIVSLLQTIESLCVDPMPRQIQQQVIERVQRVYARLEKLDEAFRLAETMARRFNPANPGDWQGQKVALLGIASASAWRRGDAAASQKYLNEAIEWAEKYSGAMGSATFEELAMIQFRAGNLGGVAALAAPRKPANQPQRSGVLMTVAAEMLKRGDLGGVAAIAPAIEARESRVYVMVQLGKAQERARDLPAARKSYDAALEALRYATQSVGGQVLCDAGCGRARTGDAQGAIQAIARARQGYRLHALRVLVYDLLNRGQPDAAMEAAKAMSQLEVQEHEWPAKFGGLIALGAPEALELATQAIVQEAAKRPSPLGAIDPLRQIAVAQRDAGNQPAASATIAKAINLMLDNLPKIDRRQGPWGFGPIAYDVVRIDGVKAIHPLLDITDEQAARAQIWVYASAAQARGNDFDGAAASLETARSLLGSSQDVSRLDEVEKAIRDLEQFWLDPRARNRDPVGSRFNPVPTQFSEMLRFRNWPGAIRLARTYASIDARDPLFAQVALTALREGDAAAALEAASLVSDPRYLRATDRGTPVLAAIAERAADNADAELAIRAMHNVQGELRIRMLLNVAQQLSESDPGGAADLVDGAVDELASPNPPGGQRTELLVKAGEIRATLGDVPEVKWVLQQLPPASLSDPNLAPRLARLRTIVGDRDAALADAQKLADAGVRSVTLLAIAETQAQRLGGW